MMKSLFAIAIGLLPALASAHIGSPNVFFDGQAGPYPVRVIIRPPAVLPGAAQVDVRVEGATGVTLQAALVGAGRRAAPEPMAAAAVAGETNLFNGAVWLYFAGAYGVTVRIEGSHGTGEVMVPLNTTALQPPRMSPRLATALVGLGALLFGGAVWFVTVSARESTLEPGAVPGPRERARAVRAAVLSAALLGGAVWAGTARWQRMDREFRANALQRPTPIQAGVQTNSALHVLHIAPALASPRAPSWDTLVADHGKLMHLFLLGEPELDVFAHLHPVRRAADRFETVLPALPAGGYRLYGEVTHENGVSETLVGSVTLSDPPGRAPRMAASTNMINEAFCQSPLATPTNTSAPRGLDADDSWHLGGRAPDSSGTPARTSRLMGGWRMTFENTDELVENREASLRFAVFTPDGEPARLEPYMGMAGHCVVRRSDGTVFTHLHPVGTISMAAQHLLTLREGGVAAAPTGMPVRPSETNRTHEVTFPYAFPRSGPYRIWVQVRLKGRVLTGVFDSSVKAAR